MKEKQIKSKDHVVSIVESFLAKHEINGANGLVVAVSGGLDSMVMLDILSTLNVRLVVAHCNFGLRDHESDDDERLVASTAEKYKIPFHTKRFDTTSYADKLKVSIQMAARKMRYEWFEQLRNQLNYNCIATAHHANDNVETILQHIIEGTGLAGLRGIQSVNKKIIRPLLTIPKSQLKQYAEENQIAFRTDSSNFKTDYQRNKIRLEVIPKLEEINPSVINTLNENSKHWQDAFLIYHQGVEKLKRRLVTQLHQQLEINIASLLSHESAETILFEILKDYGYNTLQVREIFKSLHSEPGKLFYSDTHRVVKDRKHLFISAKDIVTFEHVVEKGPSKFDLPIGKLEIETIPNSTHINFDTTKYQYVSADALVFPLTLRQWLKGDYFYPFGLNKKKKLSDFFTDKKFSLADKEQQPILLSGEHVIALPGITIDHRYQVKPSTTKSVLKIHLVRNHSR